MAEAGRHIRLGQVGGMLEPEKVVAVVAAVEVLVVALEVAGASGVAEGPAAGLEVPVERVLVHLVRLGPP